MTTEITLAEAKLHCRIDGNDEDTLIQAYIDAALEV
ncbi:TPA: head-tail connector protein, partial [Klebsiella pneumoniae]